MNFLVSKKDIIYKGNKNNIIFITGLIGSGKTTLAKEMAKSNNYITISQDLFKWSERFKDNHSQNFLAAFIKKYPETKPYFENNSWKEMDSKIIKKYRTYFNYFVIEYAEKNNKNIIYEGHNIFLDFSPEQLQDYIIIIKNTSALKAFYRRIKRDYHAIPENQRHKFRFVKIMLKQFKKYYLNHLKLLNQFIMDRNNLDEHSSL